MILTSFFHSPVLLEEIKFYLNIKNGGKYIDATLGGGGLTQVLLDKGARVLGIDQDDDAIEYCQNRYDKKLVKIIKGNFKDIAKIAKQYGFVNIDGIVFDLGVSTHQLEKSKRGFSFQSDERLDMRMDYAGKENAIEILNNFSEGDLYEIFTKYAEEFYSRAIAKHIVRARALMEIVTTGQLLKIIDRAIDSENKLIGYRDDKNRRSIYARIFQSLRIEVNKELDNLALGLSGGLQIVKKDGRLVVISYHSLEDRIVKLKFQKWAKKRLVNILTKNPVMAEFKEIRKNQKAKSAKLRALQKIVI
jgi:16S rRNA (cytosine1402-N4)-methyltransferase